MQHDRTKVVPVSYSAIRSVNVLKNNNMLVAHGQGFHIITPEGKEVCGVPNSGFSFDGIVISAAVSACETWCAISVLNRIDIYAIDGFKRLNRINYSYNHITFGNDGGLFTYAPLEKKMRKLVNYQDSAKAIDSVTLDIWLPDSFIPGISYDAIRNDILSFSGPQYSITQWDQGNQIISHGCEQEKIVSGEYSPDGSHILLNYLTSGCHIINNPKTFKSRGSQSHIIDDNGGLFLATVFCNNSCVALYSSNKQLVFWDFNHNKVIKKIDLGAKVSHVSDKRLERYFLPIMEECNMTKHLAFFSDKKRYVIVLDDVILINDTPIDALYNHGTEQACINLLMYLNVGDHLHKDVKKIIIQKLLQSSVRS